jgi:hypothetical protein
MGAAERIEEVDAFEAVDGHLGVMKERLRSPEMMGAEHSELETYVIQEGLELQRRLLQAHMELRAAREKRVAVMGSDGVQRTTTRDSSRPLVTLVGEVEVARTAYQARDVNGLHPMDSVLNLPSAAYSHGVERFVAEHAAIMSFDDVQNELTRHTGARVAKRQVEEMSVRAATDFEAFYAGRRETAEIEERTRDPLVMTFDGKGIVMVPEGLRPATKKAASKAVRKLATRLTAGEKRNRKRMAEVAAIYTVPRFVRTPQDVVADLSGTRSQEGRAQRPTVRNKRVWATVAREPEQIIEEAFQEARARDPRHQRQWSVLVDGNKDQLSIVKTAADKYGPVFIVVDLMHVLEYLWNAAHALCGASTTEAEAWVQQRLLELLEGKPATAVAATLRREARVRILQLRERAAVVDAADYLRQYAPYMRYAEAIGWGLPIATGVIEGACRYLVKDRMDRGGARWTVAGAEAVLRLRALRASGDFDAYWELHLREEQRRNHAERYSGGNIPDPLRPLRRVK